MISSGHVFLHRLFNVRFLVFTHGRLPSSCVFTFESTDSERMRKTVAVNKCPSFLSKKTNSSRYSCTETRLDNIFLTVSVGEYANDI